MVMKDTVYVIVAHGFEEMDVSVVISTLRGLGLPVAVVGMTAGPVRGAYGLSLMPDCTLGEVGRELPQAAVLPGGIQAAVRFSAEPRMHALLRQVADHNGYLMAINAARSVLCTAGVLGERSSGSDEIPECGGFERSGVGRRDRRHALDDLDGLAYEGVRVEGRVILSHSSDSAKEAALTLASMLQG